MTPACPNIAILMGGFFKNPCWVDISVDNIEVFIVNSELSPISGKKRIFFSLIIAKYILIV